MKCNHDLSRSLGWVLFQIFVVEKAKTADVVAFRVTINRHDDDIFEVRGITLLRIASAYTYL
jgi:hypothetical protein